MILKCIAIFFNTMQFHSFKGWHYEYLITEHFYTLLIQIVILFLKMLSSSSITNPIKEPKVRVHPPSEMQVFSGAFSSLFVASSCI